MLTPISTINPSLTPLGVTLSNGNLTFLNTTASDKVVTTYPLLRFGKWYWEVTNGATYGTNTVRMVGISNMGNQTATFLGSTANNLGYNGAGTVTFNNATVTTIQTYAANSVICIALDLDNNTIWFRTGAGLWNNSAPANPETNTGGIALTFTNGNGQYYRPSLGCSSVNNGATINFGDTAFTQVQPAGFNSVNNWTYSPDLANRNATVIRDETGSTNYPTVRTSASQVTNKSTFPASQQQFLYSAFYGDRRIYTPAKAETFVAGKTFVTGVLTPNVSIFVIDPTTGELLNSQRSDELGEYKLSAMGRAKVTVVGRQPTPNYNAMVFSEVVPVILGPVRGTIAKPIPITSAISGVYIYPPLPIGEMTYTGSIQRHTIPNDSTVGSVTFSIWGGGGAGGVYAGGGNGGGGGFATATFNVAPLDVIEIQVGQGGRKTVGGLGGVGGWPDGGGGAPGDTFPGGGGGSTRIWKNGQLMVVAGAGGGGSGYNVGEAGAGGGTTGQSAGGSGGTGGSQSAGGIDPSDGNGTKTGLQIINYTNRTGGWGGATGDVATSTSDDGGGGGGGYWGGGGGGGDGQSGGGGSGYLAAGVVGSMSTGSLQSAAGTSDRKYPGTGYAQGGTSTGSSATVQDGGNGYVFISNGARLTKTEENDALEFVGDLLPIPQTWTFISGDGLTASLSDTRLSLTQFSQAWWKANSGTTRRASEGSWFYEVTVTDNNPNGTLAIGIAAPGSGTTTSGNAGSSGRIQYFNTGQTRNNGTYVNYGPTFTAGDKIGCSIQPSGSDALLRFYKNGVDLGVAYTLSGAGTSFYEPHFCLYANQTDSTCILDIAATANLPLGFTVW